MFGKLVLMLALCASLLLSAGCKEDELQPTEPEGAFGLFAQALQERDADEVWEYLGKDTRQLFTDHYRALLRIDKIIQAYFDPAEHRDMRQRTGVYILEKEKIDSPQALYHFVFNLKRPGGGEDAFAFRFDEDEEVGLSISEFEYLDEEETRAQILTRGGQKFVLHKEEDGIWRTESLGDMFSGALSPIATSEANLRQYAEENLREERDRRRDVIAYFYERTGRTPPPPKAKPAAPAAPPEGASASADGAAPAPAEQPQ